MKTEFARYLKNPLYWATLGSGLFARFVMAYFDFQYRSGEFWDLASKFWNKSGSVTEGFLILLALIHLLSTDREYKTTPVITSTPCGRKHLFYTRLATGCLATGLGVLILALGNAVISKFWGHSLLHSSQLMIKISIFTLVAGMGAIGFFLFSACVCDILQNQPAAMCLCGVPFALSYFVNVGVIQKLDFFWMIRYGFFTELMRGQLIYSAPVFWAFWYSSLLCGIFAIAKNKRKGRKEL